MRDGDMRLTERPADSADALPVGRPYQGRRNDAGVHEAGNQPAGASCAIRFGMSFP